MNARVKICILTAVTFWASAFVAIRQGLLHFSPAGLGLSRFLVASVIFAFLYFFKPQSTSMSWKARVGLLMSGFIGIGIYTLMLNYGELNIPSGEASFIVAQSPLITAILAFFFLGEQINSLRLMGLLISVIGIALMTLNAKGQFVFNIYFLFVLIASISGSLFCLMQKKFLKNVSVIQATSYAVWGGTAFLMLFSGSLYHDALLVSMTDWLPVLFLGIFPSALGYLAWSYVLSNIPASRAVTYLYYMPFIATLLGWLYLSEIPTLLTILGGALAMVGVFVVDRSYKSRAVRSAVVETDYAKETVL